MTAGPNNPSTSKHVRSDKQKMEDRVRLKQVALLWWSQKIYEQASTTCCQKNLLGADKRQCYKAVLNVLAEAVEKLKHLQCPSETNKITVTEVFAQANMHYGLTPGGDQIRAFRKDPSDPNCSDDNDCPSGYICDDNDQCVYLFPELN